MAEQTHGDMLHLAAEWHAQGEPTAIATIIDTWGSAPRPRGSRMVLTASGRMAGSVSGGCVEAAVADAARKTFADGKPQTLEYGITNERAWEVGLACGGKLTIFLERVG
jgi:xanthine dehydrogenase accessory factor